jgi:hypothetical protein
VLTYPITDEEDIVKWGEGCVCGNNGKFTVKAMYDQLTVNDSGKSFTRIWKAKIPYKIKIFLRLIEIEAVLTKDNMIKRKWVGDPSCQFCEGIEDSSHLLFRCSTAKCVWAIVAKSMGVQEIPTSMEQYRTWVKKTSSERRTHICSGLINNL